MKGIVIDMSNIRYSLHHNLSDTTTGKLLYITSAVYGTDWKSFLHTHYFSELFYVVDGKGKFHFEDNSMNVERGNLVIVNPQIRHTESSSKQSPLEYIVLGIEGLNFIFDNECGYGIYQDTTIGVNIKTSLNHILHEMKTQNPYYEQVCQNMLSIMLLQFMRSTNNKLMLAPPKYVSNECSIVKRYIDTHFDENISLDTLAEISHLNKYYLAHSFSDTYGISPINYLSAQRIQCGKDHLSDTDLSISQIAQTVGFSSQSYFCQIFKKSTGLSPAEYRKQMKGSFSSAL